MRVVWRSRTPRCGRGPANKQPRSLQPREPADTRQSHSTMKSICLIVQSVYDFDPRVRRKAEALVAAGHSVDVLALRPAGGKRDYVLNGVHVYTVALGKRRGSLIRYSYEYAAFFAWAVARVTRLMRRRRYAAIDVN